MFSQSYNAKGEGSACGRKTIMLIRSFAKSCISPTAGTKSVHGRRSALARKTGTFIMALEEAGVL